MLNKSLILLFNNFVPGQTPGRHQLRPLGPLLPGVRLSSAPTIGWLSTCWTRHVPSPTTWSHGSHPAPFRQVRDYYTVGIVSCGMYCVVERAVSHLVKNDLLTLVGI